MLMEISGNGICKGSHIYFYTPSQTAKKLLYYPIAAGDYCCDSDYAVERDRYDSILALYVADGNITFIQNDIEVKAEKGELLLINCCRKHRYFTKTSAKTIWVHFDGSESRAWFDEIKSQKGQKIKDSGRLASLLREIVDNIKNDENEYLISGRIYSLLCDISSVSERSAQDDKLISINNAKQYMKEHLGECLTVSSMAKAAHLSPSYFSKLFKEATGSSPYDFLLNLRLEKAKELLHQTNLSVSEIAYQTGFNSDANFIYFFKKETNISPLKFRKLKF